MNSIGPDPYPQRMRLGIAYLLLLVLFPGSSAAYGNDATRGGAMVVAAHPLAVEAGLSVLERGGNAVDAAVAVQMVLGFVEAPETGIGGGGFLLYRDGRSGELRFYDGREIAPAAADETRFTLMGRPVPLWAAVPSGRAFGVPGMLAMLAEAHQAHGVAPWATLIQPAIDLAATGIDMPERLQAQIADDPTLVLFADMRRYFRSQAGQQPPRLRNPELAATLEAVAATGPPAFYSGALAEAIVDRARQGLGWGSDMTLEDLAGYRVMMRRPVCGQYRHWRICGAPPPSSGGIALLQILGMLERFDLAEHEPDSVEAIHLIAEASRLAFADREYHVGDPDFADVPVAGLVDPGYLAARSALIDPNRAMAQANPAQPGAASGGGGASMSATLRDQGTSHFSIVDGDGNVVALTGSIESPFGSRAMVGGFLLNNQLTDFSFSPRLGQRTHPNAVAGGKRPRSSMSPVIVIDAEGRTHLVLGSRGGSRIIGYVARTLVAVLDWGMSIEEAVAMPNFLHRGDALELEAGTPLEMLAGELESLGHRVKVTKLTSGLHGIERTAEGWRGGADPRLDGTASGILLP